MSYNKTKLQEKARDKGIDISLSSVRRIIKRAHLERAKSKWYRYNNIILQKLYF